MVVVKHCLPSLWQIRREEVLLLSSTLRVRTANFLCQVGCGKNNNNNKKKQYFTYYPVFVFPFNPYLFRLNISNPTSCHTNSHSFNSLSLSFFLSVCVTGDLQAYAVRNVTTTAGLNSTGVVVGSGTGQSLQVPKSIWGCYDACA